MSKGSKLAARELSRAIEPKVRLDSILKAIGDAKVVMIGEETHGTQEFYEIRAELTKRLIKEKGFNFVAWEADWPDAYRVHRYTYAPSDTSKLQDKSALEALGDFQRFPKWMWRNEVVLNFVTWLHNHNKTKRPSEKAGLYGLDLYSMFASAEKVIEYLEKVDKNDAEIARKRYSTLQLFRENAHAYSQALHYGQLKSCEKDIVQMLKRMLERGPAYLMGAGGYIDGDELFYATQNAHVVKNAEEYYRKTFQGGVVTWNLRDSHMLETLQHLFEHYESNGVENAKAVIWAHNSHLGDARATDTASYGEHNLGQLVRQSFGISNTFNVGMTTSMGTVTAAHNWGGQAKIFELNYAEPESYEYLFSETAAEQGECEDGEFTVILRSNNPNLKVNPTVIKILSQPRSERAVGVQYKKEREILSHYFRVCLNYQFDSVIHVHNTTALKPLEPISVAQEKKKMKLYS